MARLSFSGSPIGGATLQGTVAIDGYAPAGGATVTLAPDQMSQGTIRCQH